VVAPAQRSPAAEARAHKQKSQAVAKKLKLKMIFKKVQEGCKIRRTYGIFGYTRRDKLFIFLDVGVFHPLSRRFLSGEPGSFERVETRPRLKRLLRKKGWHRNYAKANNGCRDAPLSMTKLLFRCPALFTRSCRFHHALSTTSSATRATKSL
jgi:hypothetical protein